MRALKGLVKLQAIVRGRAVRRQAATTLKRSPSNRRGQAEIWKRSILAADEGCNDGEKKQLSSPQREFEEKEATVSEMIHMDIELLISLVYIIGEKMLV